MLNERRSLDETYKVSSCYHFRYIFLCLVISACLIPTRVSHVNNEKQFLILYLYLCDKIMTACANETKMSYILMFDNINLPGTTWIRIAFLFSAQKMIDPKLLKCCMCKQQETCSSNTWQIAVQMRIRELHIAQNIYFSGKLPKRVEKYLCCFSIVITWYERYGARLSSTLRKRHYKGLLLLVWNENESEKEKSLSRSLSLNVNEP